MMMILLVSFILVGTTASFNVDGSPLSSRIRDRRFPLIDLGENERFAYKKYGRASTHMSQRSGLAMLNNDDGDDEDHMESLPPFLHHNKDDHERGTKVGQEAQDHNHKVSSKMGSEQNTSPVRTSTPEYSAFAGQRINGASPSRIPTVWDNIGKLTKLTRPENFPGICLFHMLGVYLALDHVGQSSKYWAVLMADPSMWLVLSSLILTSSTSMVVNDYYDTKLGRDVDTAKPLVNGSIPMHLVPRYLSYLYGAALISVAFLPGVPARLSVVLALILTYLYTKHLKPITWGKNVVCAALIAFSPFTSGSAALFRTVSQGDHQLALSEVLGVSSLWRLVSVLFVGFVGREMTMDCNDVETDRFVGVWTVPARYGRKFASRICLLFSIVVTMLTVSFPGFDLLNRTLRHQATDCRLFIRFGLAVIGSSLLLRRSW